MVETVPGSRSSPFGEPVEHRPSSGVPKRAADAGLSEEISSKQRRVDFCADRNVPAGQSDESIEQRCRFRRAVDDELEATDTSGPVRGDVAFELNGCHVERDQEPPGQDLHGQAGVGPLGCVADRCLHVLESLANGGGRGAWGHDRLAE